MRDLENGGGDGGIIDGGISFPHPLFHLHWGVLFSNQFISHESNQVP